MKHLANFDDEIGGKQLKRGDEIKGVDDGTLAYLATHGRATVIEDDDPKTVAVGGGAIQAIAKGRPITEPAPKPEGDLGHDVQRGKVPGANK